jgi:peptide/nickel transport system substrate-binding protein
MNDILFLAEIPILERSFHDPSMQLDRFAYQIFSDTSLKEEAGTDAWADAFNNDQNGRSPDKLNGLGPYKLTTWKAKQELVLSRKSNDRQDGPEKIIYRFGNDETGIIRELKSQSYDFACYLSTSGFISASNEEKIRRDYHCAIVPTNGYTFLAFNRRTERHSAFKDLAVRKAVSRLIPCENIIRQLYGQYAGSILRVGSAVSSLKEECDTTLKQYAYNAPAAMHELRMAGWEDRDKDGVLENRDGPFSVRLVYRNTSLDWKTIAELIYESLSKAGIHVVLDPVDNASFSVKAASGDFDLLLGSMSGQPALEDFQAIWSTKSVGEGGKNYSGFGDIMSDALIDSINSSASRESRIALSRKLQRRIYNDYPCVFLYGLVRRNIVHKRWRNVTLLPERPGVRLDEIELRE